MKYGAFYTETARQSGASTTDAKLYVLLAYRDLLRVYPWSFTCLVTTLSVTAAAATTTLPDDFAELIELPSYAASSGKRRFVKKVPSREILDLFAQGALTGDPYKLALEASTFVPATGQRWALRWYPTPVADVTLTYCYRVIQPLLSGDDDYPAGGPMHNITLLEGALAHWEKGIGHVAGVHQQLYDKELAKSILFDQRLTAGVVLGTLETTADRRILTLVNDVTES